MIQNIHRPDLLPFSLQKELTPEKLQEWYVHRLIPKSRENYRELNTIFQQRCGKDLRRLAEYNYGLSLSDQYWFKSEQEEISWHQINFFENSFFYDAGNLFFDSEKEIENPKFVSPDFVTNGVALKTWRKKDNNHYLIKAGQSAKSQEPINEVAISIFLQTVQFPYLEPAKYTLSKIKGRLCSVSENFLTEHTELVTAYDVYHYRDRPDGKPLYTHMIEMCNLLQIPDAKKFIDSMLLFDNLISNTDRHLGNFGFLRDTETMKFIGPAPLFDNGSSLWAGEYLINDAPTITDDIAKPFCKLHSDQLKDLSYFEFAKHFDLYLFQQIFKEAAHNHLDEKQISLINKKVSNRYQNVIREIEKIKSKEISKEEAELEWEF